MTATATTDTSAPVAVPDRMQALLSLLFELLNRDESVPVEPVIQTLAKQFDAAAAGICSAAEGVVTLRLQVCSQSEGVMPARYPWEGNVALLQRLHGAARALSFDEADGSWLICQVWEPRFGEPLLAWIWQAGRRSWTTAESAALPLAGQTLARFLAKECDNSDSSARAWQMACTRRALARSAAVTSRLSHDMGNVLTGILGFAELAQQGLPAHAPARGFLREVVESAQRGAAWVHKLHLFCRRTTRPAWPVVLSALLPEQQERVRGRGKDGLTLETDVPGDLPMLGADAAAVRHLLMQLVDNACDALAGQGTVKLTARTVELDKTACRELLGEARPGPHVEIAVRDAGRGIPPEMRARLFAEVFFSTKPNYRGLGLLTSFGVLQRFGGGLRLDTPADGPGTLARIYLPVAAISTDTVPAARGARVLLVMDDPLVCVSMRRVLEAAGAIVVAAEGAHAALAQYQAASARFDLIVAEVRLTHLTGFELARRLLDREPTANFVFVQMDDPIPAPRGDDRLKRFALLTGPFDPPPLLAAIQEALTRQTVNPTAS